MASALRLTISEFFETHDGEGSTAEGVLDERIFRVKRERVKREIEIGHGGD
jgi:hypothetical protein